jgi:hypothetical protein
LHRAAIVIVGDLRRVLDLHRVAKVIVDDLGLVYVTGSRWHRVWILLGMEGTARVIVCDVRLAGWRQHGVWILLRMERTAKVVVGATRLVVRIIGVVLTAAALACLLRGAGC